MSVQWVMRAASVPIQPWGYSSPCSRQVPICSHLKYRDVVPSHGRGQEGVDRGGPEVDGAGQEKEDEGGAGC